MHINALSEIVEKSVDISGGKGVLFNTITVSDGISMGTQGMKYSLVSREVIADSMETVVQAMSYDGLVTVVGCDKNMPGALMAMIRLNRPSILLYGGTIDSGCHNGKKLDVVSAVGQHSEGKITDIELTQIESEAIPGPGSCGGI